MIYMNIKEETLVIVKGYGVGKFVRWVDTELAIINFNNDILHSEFFVHKEEIELKDKITKNIFNIYSGEMLRILVSFESCLIYEKYGFRLWTDKVFPLYDINNNYMGYFDKEKVYDMRIGWYCLICEYKTKKFWRALFHNIVHFLCVRKRKPFGKYIKGDYMKGEEYYSDENNYIMKDFHW